MDNTLVCVHVHTGLCECLGHIFSLLEVFCMSLSHPKPVPLSDDLIDLHDSVWGPVKETGPSRKMREKTTPSSPPI